MRSRRRNFNNVQSLKQQYNNHSNNVVITPENDRYINDTIPNMNKNRVINNNRVVKKEVNKQEEKEEEKINILFNLTDFKRQYLSAGDKNSQLQLLRENKNNIKKLETDNDNDTLKDLLIFLKLNMK